MFDATAIATDRATSERHSIGAALDHPHGFSR
jgi:hypothetical protein